MFTIKDSINQMQFHFFKLMIEFRSKKISHYNNGKSSLILQTAN